MNPPFTPEQIDEWRNSKKETRKLEFKAAKNSFSYDNLLGYCAAIANEKGGHLLLGVTNKRPRQVCGTLAFQNIQEIEHKIYEKLKLRVTLDEVAHPDGRVIVVDIPSRPTGHPLEVDGTYWMRSGESLVPMTADHIKKIFNEGKSGLRLFFIVVAVLILVLVAGSWAYRSYLGPRQTRPKSENLPVSPGAKNENLPHSDSVTATVKRDWHNKQNWRQWLRRNMTRTEVRNIFGEPEQIKVTSSLEEWSYGSGSITFDVDEKYPDGELYSWSEPESTQTTTPVRSYLAIDGHPVFTGSNANNVAGSNFQIGDPIGFNLYYRATGPNAVYVGGNGMATILAPSYDPEKLKNVYKSFAEEIAAEKKRNPDLMKVRWTLYTPETKRFDTAYVWDGASGHRTQHRVTQTDLDQLKLGTEVAVVVAFFDYKDGNKIHHLWYCAFLQPPAQPPGIWHMFDACPDSD